MRRTPTEEINALMTSPVGKGMKIEDMPDPSKMDVRLPSTMAQSMIPNPARDLVAQIYAQAKAAGVTDEQVLWKSVLEDPRLASDATSGIPPKILALRMAARTFAAQKSLQAGRGAVAKLQRAEDERKRLERLAREQDSAKRAADFLAKHYQVDVLGGLPKGDVAVTGLVRKGLEAQTETLRKAMEAKALELAGDTASETQKEKMLEVAYSDYVTEHHPEYVAKKKREKQVEEESKYSRDLEGFETHVNTALTAAQIQEHGRLLSGLAKNVQSGVLTAKEAMSRLDDVIKPKHEGKDPDEVPAGTQREGVEKFLEKHATEVERFRGRAGEADLKKKEDDVLAGAPTRAEFITSLRGRTSAGGATLNAAQVKQIRAMFQKLGYADPTPEELGRAR